MQTSSLSPAAESLGKRRNRRAALSGAIAMIARAIQVGSSLITVPLTLKYLGNERFGLWMTISSVLAMAAFADFGVGNGVLNTVAEAFGKDDIHAIRQALSSGFAVLSLIAAVVLGLFFAAYPLVHWASVFRVVSPQARAEAGPALIVFATCFALNIALDVVQRVQLGMQQGYRYGLWQMAGSLAGLIGVLLGIRLHVGLPNLVLAIAGAPVLSTAINAIHFFGFHRPDLRPAIACISRNTILKIARLGVLFFVLQLVVSFAFSADSFIIARTLGAAQVTDYAIPQRMFTLISMMSAMLMAPLWPAYGEALSRGDVSWVRQTLGRSLVGVFAGASVVALAILLLSHRLLALWVGKESIHPPFFLLLGLALWSVLDCCGNALAVFMNGASIIRFQIVVASIFGLVCVTAKVFLVTRFGVTAIPWATIVSYGLFTVIPCAIFIPRTLRKVRAAPLGVEAIEAVLYPLAVLHTGEE